MPYIDLGTPQQNQQAQIRPSAQPVAAAPQPPQLTTPQPTQQLAQQQQPQMLPTQLPAQVVAQQPTQPKTVEINGPSFATQKLGTNVPIVATNIQPTPLAQAIPTVIPALQPTTQIPSQNLANRFDPVNTEIWDYMSLAETRNASDIHFTVGYPVMLRIDGDLQNVGVGVLTPQRAQEIFLPTMNDVQKQKLIENKEIDYSVANPKSGDRYRVNLYYERGNLAGAFRLIPSKIKTISDLGLPDIMYEFLKYPHGLILVTGPTGSGKSTTLAALLNEINLNEPVHIISIEDPIEYIYGRGKALLDQREIDRDTMSWKNAMKSLLRQDPDVVLVGEMRDYETIASTITVAETGHLVFATLHTNSAAETIDRVIDVFPEHQQRQIRAQLANVLVGVISQRLVPVNGGGRRAVNEVLIGTPAVRNVIREGKTYQLDNMIQTGADVGMFPLEKSLAELVKSGRLSMDVAKEYTAKPELLKDLLGYAN